MNDARQHFERLFEAHEHQIRAYCSRRLDAAAVDDAVAETFTVAWRKVDQLPSGDAALPWLYGVAHRVVQHTWRSTGRRARLRNRSVSMLERPIDRVADEYGEHEERRLVLAAASRLPEADQEILRLTLWEEIPPAAAAVVLGISADAAKQRASRARKRLGDEFRRMSRSFDTHAVREGPRHE